MDRLVMLWLLQLLGAAPLDAACSCGVSSSSKIVGGVAAKIHEFPWQAALVFNGKTLPFCGGSLISSRTVLTASHCYQDISVFKVVLGAQDVSVPNSGQKSITPISFERHPSYNSTVKTFDYAIITLASDVTFDTSISPICLPVGAGAVHENKLDIISGWGTLSSGGSQPTVLQKANVTTMSNAACGSSPSQYTSAKIFPTMICAARSGIDTCQGDSGGPLVGLSATGFNYEQIGVTSWGYGCADPRYPGVYARVSEGKSWIQSKVTGTVCPAPSSAITSTTTARTSTTTSTTTTTRQTTTTTTKTTTTTSSPVCLCGVSSSGKIVGGQNAVPAQFPWQAALVFSGQTLPFCGGSLISATTVLTAAHCYTTSSFVVVLGAHDLTAPTSAQKSIMPSTFVRHPNFNPTTKENDFAIITLMNPVTFSTSISPICLPLGAGTVHENKVDIISGWGTVFFNGYQPYVLQKANVTTMSNAACIKSPYKYTSANIYPSMICAAGPGKDTCQGDSGGPMIGLAATGRSYELIGTTSFGYGCADPSYPGVYSRVSTGKTWIQNLMTGKTCLPPP